MIIIKSKREIELMREPCKVTAELFRDLEAYIKPGISTKDIDDFVENRYLKHKMTPTFKGYGGFPAAACVSVNEEIIHGIPSESRILKEGDIVSVDIGGTYHGYNSDAARTFPVGTISREDQRLIDVTRQSFFEGIKYAMEGYRIHDIGHGVQEYAEKHGMKFNPLFPCRAFNDGNIFCIEGTLMRIVQSITAEVGMRMLCTRLEFGLFCAILKGKIP